MDPRPDTEDTPPAHQRRNVVDRERAPESLEGRKGWTVEGAGVWATVALVLLGGLFGVGIWTGSLQRDIADLQSWRATHTSEGDQRKREVDARFLVDESSMRDVKASADTNFAVIKEQLGEINSKLDDLKEQKHQH